MSTATQVSVQEYLATTYHPDCDYVDGELIERNLGQKDHSKLQRRLLRWFDDRRLSLSIEVFPEQRVRVGPGRYRIPDICVVAAPEPDEQVFTEPPLICIEVLSPDDTLTQMQQRFDEYLHMGVQNLWVIEPVTRRGWRITTAGHLEALDGILRSTGNHVALPIAELFEA